MQNEYERYSCQVNLPGFGEAAQLLLQQAKVLVVGMGGLGCPVAQYLASSGVGTLGIVDNDVISISNLHRQILYNEAEVGQKKVVVAQQRLNRQNPSVNVVPHHTFINADNITDIISAYDIIVDCTDNFDTKYLLNDACVLSNKPLVFGAIYQYEGQLSVFNIPNADGSAGINYRDLFPEVNTAQIPNCAEGGVIPTLAGIIGCMQANEVIKYITKTGNLLADKLLIFDALTMQSRIIKTGIVTKTNITALAAQATVPTITQEELNELIKQQPINLIDVRTHEEHIAANIGGHNIPLDELASALASLNSSKPTVFYCATGKRSTQAVRMAIQMHPGINAVMLANGMNT